MSSEALVSSTGASCDTQKVVMSSEALVSTTGCYTESGDVIRSPGFYYRVLHIKW